MASCMLARFLAARSQHRRTGSGGVAGRTWQADMPGSCFWTSMSTWWSWMGAPHSCRTHAVAQFAADVCGARGVHLSHSLHDCLPHQPALLCCVAELHAILMQGQTSRATAHQRRALSPPPARWHRAAVGPLWHLWTQDSPRWAGWAHAILHSVLRQPQHISEVRCEDGAAIRGGDAVSKATACMRLQARPCGCCAHCSVWHLAMRYTVQVEPPTQLACCRSVSSCAE
jgi:hypothetical protein